MSLSMIYRKFISVKKVYIITFAMCSMILGMNFKAQALEGTATESVTTYGAVGNGQFNNAVALQDAIDGTPSGGVLIVPNGDYVSHAKLVIDKPITLIGQGFQKTVLNFVNCSGIEITSSNVMIKDIRIYSTATIDDEYTGIKVYNGNQISNFKLNNVDISRFSTGLRIHRLWNFVFKDMSISFVKKYGIHTTGLSTNNQISNSRIVSENLNISNSKGIYFDGSSGFSEGWMINNTLIYGFETLIHSQAMSHVYVNNSILDYSGQVGILLESVNQHTSSGWQINNNYIAVDNGQAGIHDGNSATQGSSYGNIFSKNKICAYSSMTYGIICDNNSHSNIVSENLIYKSAQNDIKIINSEGNGYKNIVTNNMCISNISYNIAAIGLVANNFGSVYYQRSQNYSKVGKMKITYDETVPTSGTWKTGDIVWKINPVEQGSSGSKYILHGWRRLRSGSSNILNVDWAEMRMLTGN